MLNDAEFYKLVNDQYNREYGAHFMYMDAAMHALQMGMHGFYCMLCSIAMDEIGDAKKIAKYSIGTMKYQPKLTLNVQTSTTFDLLETFKKANAYELSNTAYLKSLATELRERGNILYYEEVLKMIEEQAEDESETKNMLTRIEAVKNDPAKIKEIDMELSKEYASHNPCKK